MIVIIYFNYLSFLLLLLDLFVFQLCVVDLLY